MHSTLPGWREKAGRRESWSDGQSESEGRERAESEDMHLEGLASKSMKEWKLRIERGGEERGPEKEDLDTNAGLGEINEGE